MTDKEKVIKGLMVCTDRIPGEYNSNECPYELDGNDCDLNMLKDALALLKEQGKKRITLCKKYVITWKRDDEFTMGKLYEAVCETLIDEGKLIIERTDDHEKVDFVFYIT